jgi:hypothetical protein
MVVVVLNQFVAHQAATEANGVHEAALAKLLGG